MTGNNRMYVLVNSDLEMSAGKVAAQVAHAVARLDVKAPKEMLVLQATTEQLHNLSTYLTTLTLPHHLYIDEGVNEVPPMSATALAFGNVAEGFTPPFIKDFDLYTHSDMGKIARLEDRISYLEDIKRDLDKLQVQVKLVPTKVWMKYNGYFYY